MQLVCLRRTILNYVADPHHHDLLKMGVLGILVPLSQRQAQPRFAHVRRRAGSDHGRGRDPRGEVPRDD